MRLGGDVASGLVVRGEILMAAREGEVVRSASGVCRKRLEFSCVYSLELKIKKKKYYTGKNDAGRF